MIHSSSQQQKIILKAELNTTGDHLAAIWGCQMS